MDDIFTLPVGLGSAGPPGAAAPTQQAPPARGPEEAGSAADPPFSDLLEKARKRKQPETGDAVFGQMPLLALPLIAPQQPAGEAAPALENGEAAPVQAVQVQAAVPAPAEPVLDLLSQPGEAPDGAQPQQPVSAGALPEDADGPAAGVQPTVSGGALPEDADGASTGSQQPEAGAQQPALRTSQPETGPETGGSSTAPGQQQAALPQADVRTEKTLDNARPAHQDPQAVQEGASAGETVDRGKPEAAGSTSFGASYESLHTQTVKNHPAEPARLAEARRPQFVDQVSKNLLELDKSGGSTLRLQLHPEDLGKIDLRVSSGVEGLRVLLTADLPATGSLLERHLPVLRQALAEAGVNLAGLSIDYGSSPGGSPQQERWQPSGQQVLRPSAPRQEDAPAEFTSRRRGIATNGNRVDYLV